MLEAYLPSGFNMWWQLSAINAAMATLGAYEVTRTELAAQTKQIDATCVQKQQGYQQILTEHVNVLAQQKKRVSELDHSYTAASHEHLRKAECLEQLRKKRSRIVRRRP